MTLLWVIPVLLIIILGIVALWFVIKKKGGPGVRTKGRTVVDKHSGERHKHS